MKSGLHYEAAVLAQKRHRGMHLCRVVAHYYRPFFHPLSSSFGSIHSLLGVYAIWRLCSKSEVVCVGLCVWLQAIVWLTF